jgi:hypothetical protein
MQDENLSIRNPDELIHSYFLESSQRIEELFDNAMKQFRRYNGVFDEGEDEDYENLS